MSQHQYPTAGAPAANQFGTFQVHMATDAQVAFLANLLRDRDWTTADQEFLMQVTREVATGKVSKKVASRAIDVALALPLVKTAPGKPKPTGKPASPKQADLINRLWVERDHGLTDSVKEAALLNIKHASNLIDTLFAAPKAAKPGVGGRTFDAGMYIATDGRIFRAYLGQQSGKILCKEVVQVGDETYGIEACKPVYVLEYRGMADKHIPADARRMTLEEAKVWGKATGSCVKCGHRLDVPESVDAGIGPVCAKKDW